MARNGFKIFDADTHVRPDAELLEPYLSVVMRDKLKQFVAHRATNKDGNVTYLMGERDYKRRLGSLVGAKPDDKEYMSGYKRHQHGKPNPLCERDPAVRIQDMDIEGIDVNLMLPSGWFGAWTTVQDVGIETAMYEAYHHWINDYCAAYPSRLKGVICVAARDVATSLGELHRCAKEAWPLAVFVYAPYQFPLDHPDLEPIWQDRKSTRLNSSHLKLSRMPSSA